VVGDILQPTHLIFVLVIALLVLGPKRLPEVGRSLGRGLRDFRMAMGGEEPDRHEQIAQEAPVASAPMVETQAAPVASAPMVETQPAPVASAPVADAQSAPVPQWGAVHQAAPVAVADRGPGADPEPVHDAEPVEHAE
jgi:sec-independent protein translocase protein TatA